MRPEVGPDSLTEHVAQRFVDGDPGFATTSFPQRVGYRVAGAPPALADHHASAVAGSLKRLQAGEIVDLKHAQVVALLPDTEAAEPIARSLGLEHSLGDEETQLAPLLQIVVDTRIGEEHGQVLLPPAQASSVAFEGEEAVIRPEAHGGLTVLRAQALPVHPWGVADHKVELADQYRGKGVLEEARPKAVPPLHLQMVKLSVQPLQHGFRHGLGHGQLAPRAVEELLRGVFIADAALQQGRQRPHLAGGDCLTGNVKLASDCVQPVAGAEDVGLRARCEDAVAHVDGEVNRAAPIAQQVAQGQEVVGARGNDAQGVKVKADDVAQRRLKHLRRRDEMVGGVLAQPPEGENEEGAAPAAGVDDTLVGLPHVANLVQETLGKPVWRVVLAQVMPEFSRHQVLVEFLQKVSGALRLQSARRWLKVREGSRQ